MPVASATTLKHPDTYKTEWHRHLTLLPLEKGKGLFVILKFSLKPTLCTGNENIESPSLRTLLEIAVSLWGCQVMNIPDVAALERKAQVIIKPPPWCK